MNSTRVLAVAAAAVLVAAVAAPAEEKAPMAPKPAPEMAQLKAFEHSFTCTGQADASPFGPAHATSSRVHAHSSLGGFWVSGMVQENKTAENPTAMEGMFHMTWDTGNKRFLMLWVDNGGGWSQETSPGWNGDTMVWSGEGWMGGQKLTSRDTFTKKGEETLEHSWELNLNGTWTPLGHETCTAAAPAMHHMMKH
jgi:hypothetical protein